MGGALADHLPKEELLKTPTIITALIGRAAVGAVRGERAASRGERGNPVEL